MEDQARHIYKKVESENTDNVDTIKQEIEADKLGKIDNEEGEINLYHKIITNKVEKDNTILSQMEKQSILSNIVNYIQYDRHKNFYYLVIKAVDQKNHKRICNKEEKNRY